MAGNCPGSSLINVSLTSKYFSGGTEENKEKITGLGAEISTWDLIRSNINPLTSLRKVLVIIRIHNLIHKTQAFKRTLWIHVTTRNISPSHKIYEFSKGMLL